MATATCKTLAGPYSAAQPAKARTSTCQTIAGAAMATGAVAWGGSAAKRRQVNWLPSATTPVLDDQGCFTRQWYLFLVEVANKRLGGLEAPTVPDVATGQAKTQGQVLLVQSNADAAIAAVNACVVSTNTARDVAISNNLAGATQIPIVQPAFPRQ